MKPLTLLPLLVLTSEAARLVEEIILRDGDQREREERRFESEVGHEQEVIEVIIKEDLEIEGPTPSTVYKGLVPQLWPNYTGPIEPKAESVSCGEARAKCEFRDGCRFALQNYGLFCLDLVQGKTNVCSAHCRHALTALMSTHEGKRLMKVSIVLSICIGIPLEKCLTILLQLQSKAANLIVKTAGKTCLFSLKRKDF